MARGRRNYSLVVNSRFRPFSYDEMLKPLLQQTQAQQVLEEAYDTAGTQAAAMSAYINKDTDPNAYQKYQTFMQGLAARAGELSAYGLTPSSRQGLSSMRTMYGTEIVPIQQAIQRRQQFADEQRKLGPNYVFDNDASTMSLDDLIANPQLSYSARNLAEIAQESSNVFGQLQKDLQEYSLVNGADDRIKNKFYNVFKQRHGITPEQATTFINNVKQGIKEGKSPQQIIDENPMLGTIYMNLFDAQNVRDWTPDKQQRISDAILKGVTFGIGQTQVNLMEDPMEKAKLDIWKANQLADIEVNKAARINRIKNPPPNDDNFTPTYTRLGLNNTEEVNKKDTEFKDMIKRNVITRGDDGSYDINRDALRLVGVRERKEWTKEQEKQALGKITTAVKARRYNALLKQYDGKFSSLDEVKKEMDKHNVKVPLVEPMLAEHIYKDSKGKIRFKPFNVFEVTTSNGIETLPIDEYETDPMLSSILAQEVPDLFVANTPEFKSDGYKYTLGEQAYTPKNMARIKTAINKYYNKEIQGTEYDMYQKQIFKDPITDNQEQEAWGEQLLAQYKDDEVPAVEYGKDGYKRKDINKSDLDGMSVTDIDVTTANELALVTFSDGKKKTIQVPIPVTLNRTTMRSVAQIMKDVRSLQSAIQQGKIPQFSVQSGEIILDKNSNGDIIISDVPMYPQEKQRFEKKMEKMIQTALDELRAAVLGKEIKRPTIKGEDLQNDINNFYIGY